MKDSLMSFFFFLENTKNKEKQQIEINLFKYASNITLNRLEMYTCN